MDDKIPSLAPDLPLRPKTPNLQKENKSDKNNEGHLLGRTVKQNASPSTKAQKNNAIRKGAQLGNKSFFSRVAKHIENFFDHLLLPRKYQNQLGRIKLNAGKFFRSCCDLRNVPDISAATSLGWEIQRIRNQLSKDEKKEKYGLTVESDLKNISSDFADYLMGCEPKYVENFIDLIKLFSAENRFDYTFAWEVAPDVLRRLQSNIENLPEQEQFAWNRAKDKLKELKVVSDSRGDAGMITIAQSSKA
jgi:hypothetical protein